MEVPIVRRAGAGDAILLPQLRAPRAFAASVAGSNEWPGALLVFFALPGTVLVLVASLMAFWASEPSVPPQPRRSILFRWWIWGALSLMVAARGLLCLPLWLRIAQMVPIMFIRRAIFRVFIGTPWVGILSVPVLRL